MVDITEISAVVAAAGIVVGVVYYILDLRHNTRAREMEICRLVSSDYTSEQGCQRYATMMTLQWKDLNDFMQKYGVLGSNLEMFGKWASQFAAWEIMGLLLKNKIIKAEEIHELSGYVAIPAWEKYKDIIQGLRNYIYGKNMYSNAEFFAQEMLRISIEKDASFKDKLEAYIKRLKA